MKTIYYCLTYNDGIKQYLSRQIPDNLEYNSVEDILFESDGIKSIKTFNNREEWEFSKKNQY